jgi:trk system potassium uptake protein TrkA
MNLQFVVVGLGRLGISMIETLDSLGHEVLAIDKDEGVVQDLADDLPDVHFVAADATDEDAMRGLNVDGFDAAAVMIGEDHIEAGILATATLKEVRVPGIVARATGSIHARVLERVGADRVIEPEREIGKQVARTIASPGLLGYVDLGEDEVLIETRVPREWLDKSLVELELSQKMGLTVMAVKPKGGPGSLPQGDTVLHDGDVLVVGGSKEDLDGSPLVQPDG